MSVVTPFKMFSKACAHLRRVLQKKSWHPLLAAALCVAPLGVSLAAPRSCNMPAMSRAQLAEFNAAQWVERIAAASDLNSYSGTFVVMSSSGVMNSSRVWHACTRERQIERLEALSGSPRIVYRENAQVRTFLPQERVVRIQARAMPGKFPRAENLDGANLSVHYAAQLQGEERVAGVDADVVQFRPRDAWRFGYRAWIDRASGLVLKWQTIAPSGRVLEQAAFSDLDMSVPVSAQQMSAMMNDVVGFRVLKAHREITTMQAHGWQLPVQVDGFVLLECSQQHAGVQEPGSQPQPQSQQQQQQQQQQSPTDHPPSMVQCVYSDGLASISLFLERHVREQRANEGQAMRLGATHTLTGRVAGDAWVTMVGEVPLATLRRFASAIKQAAH